MNFMYLHKSVSEC